MPKLFQDLMIIVALLALAFAAMYFTQTHTPTVIPSAQK